MIKTDPIPMFEQICDKVKKGSGGQYVSLCPFHQDTKHSFSFNEEGQYNCKSCGAKGNAITFAREFDFNEKDYYSNDYQPPKKETENKRKTNGLQLINLQEKAKYYSRRVAYGLMDDRYALWQMNDVGRSEDEARTFPYKDKFGQVVGIKFHKNKDGKSYWKGNGSAKWYLAWSLDLMNKDKLFFCEGEGDTLFMNELENAIGTSGGVGTIPSFEPIKERLLEKKDNIYILYDNDKYGDEGAKKLASKLYSELDIKAHICKWDESLIDGYDISDDMKSNQGIEVKRAIENAVQFKPKINDIKVIGVSSYMKLETEKTQRIVEYLCDSQSTSVIGGDTGVGKSWLGLNIALAISSGQKFMDYFEVKESKVLLAQFELTDDQVQRRLQKLMPHFENNWNKVDNNLLIMPRGSAFVDQWQNIKQLIAERQLQGTTLIVDNLYTSITTDLDLTNNNDIAKVLKIVDAIQKEFNLTIILVTHHLKHRAELIITMDDILGGASLTRFASNVFQMKSSTLSNDYKIGKITKVRDEDCNLEKIPFKMKFDEGYFTKGDIIPNEVLHYKGVSERWEIKLLSELKNYVEQYNDVELSREYLREYLKSEQRWDIVNQQSFETKITRLLRKWQDFGLIKKDKHNNYQILKSDVFDPES